MTAILAYNHMSQKPRGCDPPLQKPIGQSRDERRKVRRIAPNVAAADQAPAQEPGRLIIQLLTDFLADAAPGFRGLFDWLGVDHFFDDREIFREPRAALAPELFSGRPVHLKV